jgi:hypothetical protein
MKKIVYILFLLVFPSVIYCQVSNQEIEKMLKDDFTNIRKDGISRINEPRFDSSNENYFFNFLKKYKNDQSINVRSRVKSLQFVIALKSIDTLIRQELVLDLIIDGSDFEPSINQEAFGHLSYFKEHDFSPKAKKMIITLFNKPNYDHNFILACGTAQVKELIPELKKLATSFNRKQEGWYSTMSWFANLALVKMGEVEKIDNIISAVELELNTDLRVTRLLKYVVYTKDPDCIRLILKYMASSEKVTGLHGMEGLGFNQYIVEYLSREFEDFPVKTKTIGAYTKEETEKTLAFLENYLSKNADK